MEVLEAQPHSLRTPTADHCRQEKSMANVALVGCAHIHTPGFVKRLQARGDVRTVAVWGPAIRREPRPTALSSPRRSPTTLTPSGTMTGLTASSSARRPTGTRRWSWPRPRPASTCLWRSRWASARATHIAWPKRSSRRASSSRRATSSAASPAHQALRDLVARGVFGRITRAPLCQLPLGRAARHLHAPAGCG